MIAAIVTPNFWLVGVTGDLGPGLDTLVALTAGRVIAEAAAPGRPGVIVSVDVAAGDALTPAVDGDASPPAFRKWTRLLAATATLAGVP